MTILESILNDLLSKGDRKVCVDFDNPKLRKLFFQRYDDLHYLNTGRRIKNGSWLFDKAMNEYKLQSYQINLAKLTDDKGYYLVRGLKYLFAVKENVLNLYDKE